ncbi:ribonuclease [Sphingoaurantiacus capsulatus]|uniref:Ribonuclease n=1 Tax=Sphingoaurantiacus capsulatus TaxID=1771310 RepID=A0ABV7XE80_9SPHN
MSSEIILERGIGELRAARVENGRIAELHIERDGTGLRAGAIVEGRLTRILLAEQRGIVSAGGEDALIEPLPRGVTEGAKLLVEVLREAIPEAGRAKLAKVRASEGPVREAPTLLDRLRATNLLIREVSPAAPDLLENAGWSEAVEEAATGVAAFNGGLLTISPTPAMTVIDVDGALPPPELAVAGAGAAARAIRRFGLAGSIGIDLPTVGDKAVRQRAAEAIDAELPPPFERTAVNGFGFVQIVRPRARPSIVELLQGDPAASAALALLRRGEREAGVGPRTLVAAPGIIGWLEARPALTAELARRLGVAVGLRADPRLAISASHVDVRPR